MGKRTLFSEYTDLANDKQRVCTTCTFCLQEHFGYSNYTVEGSSITCLLGKNPNLHRREFSEELTPDDADCLDFAQTCDKYNFGAPAMLDVEKEHIGSDLYDGKYLSVLSSIRKHYANTHAATWALFKYLLRR